MEVIMKVSFFLPSLEVGGAERVMLNLAKGFVEKGINVDIVLATTKGEYLKQVPSNINLVDLGAARVSTCLLHLVKYFKKEKPSAFISAIAHANIISLWAKEISRVKTKVLVSEHTTVSQIAKNFKGTIMILLRKKFYPIADKVIAVSRGVADDLIKQTNIEEQKVKVIYNPVIDEYLLKKSKDKIEDIWFNNSEEPIILSVGRLTEAKDYETLIKSFLLVKDKIKARLVILGEGELRPDLEKLTSQLNLDNYVLMPGFIENPYKYMANAKIFVLSSKREGLPTVLIEALACGAKVISTDCPSGPCEILGSGKYGHLVKVGDVKQMAQTIIESINSSKSNYDKNDLESHLEQFKFQNVVNSYLELILEN